MDNQNKNRRESINTSDIEANNESRDDEDLDFLKGLTDQELDDLLDCVIEDSQDNEQDSRIIDAIMDEVKRRSSDEFVMNDMEPQKALERFYERAKSRGIIIDNKRKSDQ